MKDTRTIVATRSWIVTDHELLQYKQIAYAFGASLLASAIVLGACIIVAALLV